MLTGIILPLCVIGIYSVNNSTIELWFILFFGAIGYGMRKLGFPPVVFVLAFILGPLMEVSLRQALIIFNGRVKGFFQNPVSAFLLFFSFFMIVLNLILLQRKGSRNAEA
jgi:putative tricarboxylic transport membrane protein